MYPTSWTTPAEGGDISKGLLFCVMIFWGVINMAKIVTNIQNQRIVTIVFTLWLSEHDRILLQTIDI